MTGPSKATVREAVRDRHDRGNSYVKATHVAYQLPDADPQDSTTLSAIGSQLAALGREELLERWSADNTKQTVWRIVPDDEREEDDERAVATDGGYPQPEIGDRVTYIDGDGDEHRALVLDACSGDPYITVVTGAQGDLGVEYNHDADAHASTFPHTSVWDDGQAMDTYAFILGWSE